MKHGFPSRKAETDVGGKKRAIPSKKPYLNKQKPGPSYSFFKGFSGEDPSGFGGGEEASFNEKPSVVRKYNYNVRRNVCKYTNIAVLAPGRDVGGQREGKGSNYTIPLF